MHGIRRLRRLWFTPAALSAVWLSGPAPAAEPVKALPAPAAPPASRESATEPARPPLPGKCLLGNWCKACLFDVARGRAILRCCDDPEPMSLYPLLGEDCLKEEWIDAASTPLRERLKIPKIAITLIKVERELQFANIGATPGHPAIAAGAPFNRAM